MRASLILAALALLLTTPAAAKDPALGDTTFELFEAWLSPHQEGNEETEMPKLAARAGLANTKPSTPREQRPSRGWGQIKFARNMSKAIVDVQITGVDPDDIVMFHIHCGRPGVLGPILVDLGGHHGEHKLDITKAFPEGRFQKEIRNADIKYVKDLPGLAPRLPEACPIGSGLPGQVMTVGGMYHIARRGLLYFNLHTKAHTYYGEIRGQIYPVVPTEADED